MTVYDIAREAGVSVSSVSRAINNKPGVSKENREKIRLLLQKYHYQPNEAARELVTSSSKMVGILVADVRIQHHIEGAYHIAHELANHGYCSLILNTGRTEQEHEDAIQTLGRRNVEAAVLMGSVFESQTIQAAVLHYLPNIPIFMLNGFLDLPNVYGVLSDEKSGVEDCVQLLARKGRRSIAFFVDDPTPSSLRKTQGFQSGMSALGVQAEDAWLYRQVEGSVQGGYEATRRLLAEHPGVNGLICSLDIIACGAIQAIHAAGKRVPEDIAVIGIDNSIYTEICVPHLTSLDNMIFDSGVMIAHKLVDCLEGRDSNQKTLLFTRIHERDTT